MKLVAHLDIDWTMVGFPSDGPFYGSEEFLRWLLDNVDEVIWCTSWVWCAENGEELAQQLHNAYGYDLELLRRVRYALRWKTHRLETCQPDALNVYIDDEEVHCGFDPVQDKNTLAPHAPAPWIRIVPEAAGEPENRHPDYERIKQILDIIRKGLE